MKKIHLCLIGITTLFLTACTVGVSSNKNSVIKDTDSITNLTVTFDFNGGTYNGSTEQVEFNDVKPTSYWKYVQARIDEAKITPPEHTAFEGFSFAEDDPSIIQDSYVIKEDITVYAQYKAKEGEYCIVNWKDGVTSEIIKTETYFENQTPDFKDIPYHEGKVFKCWEPEITPITHEDVGIGKSRTYTAIYDPIETYHIVKLDYNDGTEQPIHTQKVFHEECVVKPEIAKEGYKLDKWEYTGEKSGTFNFDTKIIEDIEIKAIWEKATYTVTWLNYDGTPLEAKKKEYEDGDIPEYDGDILPTRKSDAFYDYEFTGEWVPAPSEIHDNMTYVATYRVEHIYGDTKAYMHINIVEDNKDFEFACTATSSVTVDWGDGTPQETREPGTISHIYANTGEFNIRIFDPITSIAVSSITPPPDSALIEELYLGKDVTSIGIYAFYRCSNLQTVTFEKGSKLTSIGGYAFSSCSSLTGITIPSGIKLIVDSTFKKCSQLQAVTFEEGSQVTSIDGNAFRECSSLAKINIPSGVKSIGISTFEDCSQLQAVTFEEGSQLTSIGNRAFYGCSALTSINIPSGVTSIGKYAFEYCSSLTGITIPSGVTSIGESAFYVCSALTSINIPSGVKSIGNYTFYKCSQLQAVTFEEGSQLTSIGKYAFEYCSSLTEITIPSGVTSIDESAFDTCSNLQTVDLTALNSVPALGVFAFWNHHKNLKIHVKTNMLEAFKTADGWEEYKGIITDEPVPSATTNIK